MAQRPVFIPRFGNELLVETRMVEFTWHPGVTVSQKQKSIASLHQAAIQQLGLGAVLEISTKSPVPLGVALSAFNLAFRTQSGARALPVEVIYQSAKVFTNGGPYLDIRDKTPIEAKQDSRLKESGDLLRFESGGVSWELEPKTAFYDWVYLNVLRRHSELAEQVSQYEGFTDIEFNPSKSVNCQAYSVALFVALTQRQLLEQALQSRDDFIATITRFSPGETQSDSGFNRVLF
ncbi:DarT1-associated NADAR antitoxin family protein [Aromatoleum aromaticum]|mgnify:FL=1|uniref:DarT1-associated NADAR antitoxin family protein n=1 Tax=Aromatoleum aromaticum TaxID=551760 RepID=UPI0014592AE5|nr:hypothetical protein [Aromatoleum aromaticum]